jgi:hypothetical protein
MLVPCIHENKRGQITEKKLQRCQQPPLKKKC